MDFSLDELIRFLLEEIALSGDQGTLPSDILEFVNQYHVRTRTDRLHGLHHEEPNSQDDSLMFKLDRPYQEQVWRWLTRHPEISVGNDGEGDQMSLSDVEAHNKPAHQEVVKGNEEMDRLPYTPTVSSNYAADSSTSNAGLENTQTGQYEQSKPSSSHFHISTQPPPPRVSLLKVYASQDRRWYAAAGHGPDLERIPALEFACLSIIAAHGSNGILQPDLVKISGQDKRSVPVRTQNLHNKGYIVKKAMLFAGNRTSKCTLKRFANDAPLPQSIFSAIETPLRQVFDVLKDAKLMTWDDLKKSVGVWRQFKPSRLLARAVRRFESMGCLQRVRAPGNTEHDFKHFYKCVKLIRQPQEAEVQEFLKLSRDAISQNPSVPCGDEYEDGEDMEEDYQLDPSEQVDVNDTEEPQPEHGQLQSPALSWAPDRLLVHVLYDLVMERGILGTSSMTIRDEIVGEFYQRPIEHLMGRLVELWQISQPLHLRHLAILRDTTISGKMAHYIHYTYPTFKSMVDAGEASWEAVETIKAERKKGEGTIVAIDALPDLDEYGFPRLDVTQLQGLNNDASLVEIVRAAKIPPFKVTNRDPRVLKMKAGTYDIHYGRPYITHRNSTQGAGIHLSDHDSPAFDSPSKYGDDAKNTSYQYYFNQAVHKKPEIDRNGKSRRGNPRKIPKTTFPKAGGELDSEHITKVAKSGNRVRKNQKVNSNEKEVHPASGSQDRFGPYIPSIAAHSFLASAGPANFPEVRKKRSYRSRKVLSTIGYYPSIIAHTLPDLGDKREIQPTSRDTISGVMLREPHCGILPPSGEHSHPGSHSNKSPLHIEHATYNQDSSLIELQSSFLLDLAQGFCDTGSPERYKSISTGNKRKSDIEGVLTSQPPAKRRGRPAKSKVIELTPFKYLPSIVAHTQPTFARIEKARPVAKPPVVSRVSRVRKQSAKAMESQMVQENDALVGSVRLEGLRDLLTYAEQVKRVKRPHSGVFVGVPADLKSLHRQGRPRKSQVAVFKLPALVHFDWFGGQSSTYSQQPIELAREANQAVSGSFAEVTTFGATSFASNSQAIENIDCQLNAPENSNPPRMLAKDTAIVYTSPYSNIAEESLQAPMISTLAKRKRVQSPQPQQQHLRSGHSSPTTKRRKQVFNTAPQRIGKGIQATPAILNDFSVSHQQSMTLAAATAGNNAHDFPSMAPYNSPYPRIVCQDELPNEARDSNDGKEVDQESTSVVSTQNERILEQASALGNNPTRDKMDVAAAIPHSSFESTNDYRKELAIEPVFAWQRTSSQVSAKSANESIVPAYSQRLTTSGSAGNLTTGCSSQSTESGLGTTILRTPENSMLSENILQAALVRSGSESPLERTKKLWNGAHREIEMISSRRPDSPARTTVAEAANKSAGSAVFHDNGNYPSLEGSVKITKIKVSSGSLAALRRKIIMEIIEKCGGIFPGNREIAYPFYASWESNTKSGKPDQRTIEAAIEFLVKSNKLRTLRFTYNNRGGVEVTKSILTLPSVSPTDPRISEMQQKIIENDPRWYVPDVPGIFKKPTQTLASKKKLGDEDQRVTRQYDQAIRKKAPNGLRKKRAEERKRQLEEELGDPEFSIEGYSHNRARVRSEIAGLAAFRPHPDGIWERAKPLVSRSGVRRLDRLNTQSPYVDMLGHPHARRIYRNRLVLNTISRSRTSSYPFPPSGMSQLQFQENLGLHSNFERTTSAEYDVADSEDEYQLDPSGVGDEFYWIPESGEIVTRMKNVWHTLTIQLQDIAIQCRKSFPEWMNRRISSKQIHRSMPAIVRNAINVRRQYQALMDPRQLFHITTGTYAAEFIVTEGKKAVRKKRFRAPETCISLPLDIDDLLSKPYDIRYIGPWDRFNIERDILWDQIEQIKRWELGTPELASTDFQTWRFINLKLPSSLVAEHKAIWNQFSADGMWGQDETSEEPSRNHPAAVFVPISTAVGGETAVPITKPRRLLTLQHNLPVLQRQQIEEEPIYTDRSVLKRIRLRGPQLGQVMGPDGDRRILVAVIVVRTLTGGLEQNIDWVLLSHIFARHQYSERLIHQRYAYLAHKYRLMADKLQADFQEMFAQAYEDSTVPPLDYDDLENYDWNGLIDWTMENIEAPRSGLPELPSTREKLDSIFDLRDFVEKDLSEFYEIDGVATVPKRRTLMYRDTYAVPLPTALLANNATDRHSIARSWIRANVITPEENYLPDLAREKFEAIGEKDVENAVRDLLMLKVIMLESKGRSVTGRNYDISDYFVSRLRKNLLAENFREAAKYKSYLDEEFLTKGTVEFSWHASNGDVVAVLNLAAHQRIKLVPKDPPMKPFGLLDFGYRTRKVDRNRLIFTVELQPTASYFTGNPLLPIPAPPGPVPCITCLESTEATTSPSFSKIPAWRDIHGNLVAVMWELALAAVLSVMAVRPGVKASDVEKCVRPSLEVWEVESLMQWCVEAGVGTWTKGDDGKDPGGGIKLSEWWWLVFGESVGEMEVGCDVAMGEGRV